MSASVWVLRGAFGEVKSCVPERFSGHELIHAIYEQSDDLDVGIYDIHEFVYKGTPMSNGYTLHLEPLAPAPAARVPEPEELTDMRRDVREYANAHHSEELGDRWTIGNIRAVVEYVDALQREPLPSGVRTVPEHVLKLVTERISALRKYRPQIDTMPDGPEKSALHRYVDGYEAEAATLETELAQLDARRGAGEAWREHVGYIVLQDGALVSSHRGIPLSDTLKRAQQTKREYGGEVFALYEVSGEPITQPLPQEPA